MKKIKEIDYKKGLETNKQNLQTNISTNRKKEKI